MNSIPEKYRMILTLHHGEGFAVDTIAVMLRLPKSTVKWRLQEGRRLLGAALREEVD